ncbi:MAG: hypothetical protein ACRYG7_08850 [Janthinobacterium lividum]
MNMRLVNGTFSLLLAMVTALLSQFFIGSQEQHKQLTEQYFWNTLGLRFTFFSFVGLVGVGLWWGVNYGLLKSGLVPGINLQKTALVLTIGAVSGSLVGALVFCFA